MILFLVASGVSLIFGVLGISNFAHGSFYMVGAYCMKGRKMHGRRRQLRLET
jgi:branched-subunit amino acid ABC-type transport system permease component